jgi:hypothetical protein
MMMCGGVASIVRLGGVLWAKALPDIMLMSVERMLTGATLPFGGFVNGPPPCFGSPRENLDEFLDKR